MQTNDVFLSKNTKYVFLCATRLDALKTYSEIHGIGDDCRIFLDIEVPKGSTTRELWQSESCDIYRSAMRCDQHINDIADKVIGLRLSIPDTYEEAYPRGNIDGFVVHFVKKFRNVTALDVWCEIPRIGPTVVDAIAKHLPSLTTLRIPAHMLGTKQRSRETCRPLRNATTVIIYNLFDCEKIENAALLFPETRRLYVSTHEVAASSVLQTLAATKFRVDEIAIDETGSARSSVNARIRRTQSENALDVRSLRVSLDIGELVDVMHSVRGVRELVVDFENADCTRKPPLEAPSISVPERVKIIASCSADISHLAFTFRGWREAKKIILDVSCGLSEKETATLSAFEYMVGGDDPPCPASKPGRFRVVHTRYGRGREERNDTFTKWPLGYAFDALCSDWFFPSDVFF
jgi:hypothetical protein